MSIRSSGLYNLVIKNHYTLKRGGGVEFVKKIL